MTEEIVKEGFEQAQKEAREEQVREVKEIVSKTLTKLDEVKDKIKELRKEEKILKMDIEDLKQGKIDRIVERQEKDPKAKETSVVVIIKEKEVIRETNPWYWPYKVFWNEPYTPVWHTDVYCGTGQQVNHSFTLGGTNLVDNQLQNSTSGVINCSVAKNAAIGTYEVNGEPVHLR